jgi:tRNA G37 N-methylase Trm5
VLNESAPRKASDRNSIIHVHNSMKTSQIEDESSKNLFEMGKKVENEKLLFENEDDHFETIRVMEGPQRPFKFGNSGVESLP